MTATYRFVGEAPEVFAELSGVMAVAGVERDPDAPGYLAPHEDGYQPPGELRPGQEFTAPEGLAHARVELQTAAGDWVSSVPEPEPEQPPTEQPPTEQPLAPAPEPSAVATTDAGPGRRARATAEEA